MPSQKYYRTGGDCLLWWRRHGIWIGLPCHLAYRSNADGLQKGSFRPLRCVRLQQKMVMSASAERDAVSRLLDWPLEMSHKECGQKHLMKTEENRNGNESS